MQSKTKCSNQPLVLRYTLLLLAGFLFLMLSACGGGSGQAGSATGNDSAAINNSAGSDLKIAQSLYFDDRIPAGFYREQYQSDAYYVTTHLKNTDLLAIAARSGVAAFELTSDDFTEAMSWSEQSESFQASYRQLVDNSEAQLYRQFTRVDPDSPEIIYLHRVLKASVIDRNGVDDSYKGRITLVNMSIDDVKLIIEYLWTFTISNNYGYAVLSSETTETADSFVHTMQQARLNMSFSESCDSVELYEITYTVSKASGFIIKDEVLKRVMSAKRTGDYVEICGV